jgi:peptidoglycan/xylan/chitin deacetylase (PgdA/CDA1 family)
MTWDQVRAAAAKGFDIQCHSKSHRNLTQPSKGESFAQFFKALEAEVVMAKRQLEGQLQTQCRYLAYPYGATNALVVAMLQKHGYRGGLTVRRGSNAFDTDPYQVKRSVIYGYYDLNRFQQNLTVFEKMELR